MNTWNIFKKGENRSNLRHYEVNYTDFALFGVTAESAIEAEAIVCEEVFNNQTIPGIPEIKEIYKSDIEIKYKLISAKLLEQKGIWFPER